MSYIWERGLNEMKLIVTSLDYDIFYHVRHVINYKRVSIDEAK